jgi:hypothetical protein
MGQPARDKPHPAGLMSIFTVEIYASAPAGLLVSKAIFAVEAGMIAPTTPR